MKTNQKILASLALLGLFAIPIVAAYTFTIDEEVVLEGTSFEIDGELFKYESGEHYVNLDDTWHRLDDETYTNYNPSTIVMTTDVECGYFDTEPGPGSYFEFVCLQEGGGSGN